MNKIELERSDVNVPLTVPYTAEGVYIDNYLNITKNSGKLFLFAGDQKIEHLNKDFYGEGISEQDASPEHLFNIASQADIGAFATQLGLIAKYGRDYKDINYIVKLNSKTDFISSVVRDPISSLLHSVTDVMLFANSSELPIVGVGYTIYLGSEFESHMLSQAAQIVFEAHQHGLLAILWIYPRGKAVQAEQSPETIAGAAGVAACLGADFVKINPPADSNIIESANKLKQATLAAGRTGVICSGGNLKEPKDFLQQLYAQIHIGASSGCAVGRNIHQRDLKEAVKFCNAIKSIVTDGASIEDGQKFL